MEIEKPQYGPVTWHRGLPYPTIGAFYDAVIGAFSDVQPSISSTGQLAVDLHDVTVPKILNVPDAIDKLTLVKEQGEGTPGNPYFGTTPGTLAHYFRFGEILNQHRIKKVGAQWLYKGAKLPFPDDIFPMATIPKAGYSESETFDREYTSMLHSLQKAWEHADYTCLDAAFGQMKNVLPGLATSLMQMPLKPGAKETFGPCFKLTEL
jgi:hypothetical protein